MLNCEGTFSGINVKKEPKKVKPGFFFLIYKNLYEL
jgi:hypothetical protein